MQLLTNGQTIDVAQSGPDFLLLAHAAQIPAGEAELIVTVNGTETKRRFLISEPADGIRVNGREIAAAHPALAD